MKQTPEDSRSLDQVKAFIELTFPGREFIVWLFDDHRDHQNRLMDTPVNFSASHGIGGEKRAGNLMRAKLDQWKKLDEQAEPRT